MVYAKNVMFKINMIRKKKNIGIGILLQKLIVANSVV
jgi:hypothetical protein